MIGTIFFTFSTRCELLGLRQELWWSVLNHLVLLCSLLSIADADLRRSLLEKEALSPVADLLDAVALPELSLPVDRSLQHRSHWNRLSPYGPPDRPPNYGHFMASDPPSSSHLSRRSVKSGSVPESANVLPSRHEEIAPSHPGPSGSLPSGLAQPPLSPSFSSKIGVLF